MAVRTRKLALTEGIAAGILFGTASIFIRFLQALDAFSTAFWRLIIAAAILVTLLLVLRKSFSLDLVRSNFRDLITLSVFLGLHFIFFISAVKDTTILNATVLVNTTPIFSMFVSSFLFKIKPSRLAIIGLTISFAGVCVIAISETITSGSSSVPGLAPHLKGDLEAVLAALVESFYLNYGRRIRSRMTIVPIMFPMYILTAGVVELIGIPITGSISTVPTDVKTILPLVGLGILPTAMAHTLYFSSLSNLKAFETATMALLEPVGATILAMLIFQEIPAFPFVLGATLVLFGILFIVRQTE
jgi:drug/metabolite transporter (DMT)-like permease